MGSEPICVATYADELSAELARTRLEANGIDAFISRDDCGGMRPYLQAVTGVRLMVRKSDAAAATAILNGVAGAPE